MIPIHRPASRIRALAPLLCLAALVSFPPALARAQESLDGTWTQLDPALAAPPAHRGYVSIFDQGRDRYVIFGGEDARAPSPVSLNLDVWALDLGESPAWSLLDVAPGPGRRHGAQAGYDPARDRLIVFGGYGYHDANSTVTDYLQDVWELSFRGTPQWRELNPVGTPPSGRLGGASIYDPIRQRLVVFGGTVGATADVYTLDLSHGDAVEWSVLSATGTPPVPGYQMASIYDPVRDRMILFGGSTSDDYYGVQNDAWALSLGDAPEWTHLVPEGTPPSARRTMGSLYDPVHDRMIVFGGWDNLSNSTTSFLSDTYALSLAGTPTWTALAPQGGPPAGRDYMAAAYDALQNRLVVYGGWTGAEMVSDTWFLDWGDAGAAATIASSAAVQGQAAQVDWQVSGATGATVGLFRRAPGGDWSSIATPRLDAAGHLAFTDPNVVAGQHYDYLVAVSTHAGEQFDGQVSVDVPGTVGAGGGPALSFALAPLRPNPSRDGRLHVSFTLARLGPARLVVYDVTGRRIAEQEVGDLGPGDHEVILGAHGKYAPGLYFVSLRAPGVSLEQRAVVIGN